MALFIRSPFKAVQTFYYLGFLPMKYTILTLCGALLLFTSVRAYADEYKLTIAREPVNITGKTVEKITINGGIPGPTLRFKEGEDVIIHVTNKMDEDTSVHWHGLLGVCSS
tara:strand:+ start:16916 stop:17248 length:333 start_codon:yes stop_codon:yes gene_type:complete